MTGRAMTPADEPCETCGRPDIDHTFKELLLCLYGDQGLTPEKADTVIDNLTSELDP
jgi:hypothetical protein